MVVTNDEVVKVDILEGFGPRNMDQVGDSKERNKSR